MGILAVMFVLVLTASASMHLELSKPRKTEFHSTPLRPRKAA